MLLKFQAAAGDGAAAGRDGVGGADRAGGGAGRGDFFKLRNTFQAAGDEVAAGFWAGWAAGAVRGAVGVLLAVDVSPDVFTGCGGWAAEWLLAGCWADCPRFKVAMFIWTLLWLLLGPMFAPIKILEAAAGLLGSLIKLKLFVNSVMKTHDNNFAKEHSLRNK